jgi:hypothetical protein
MAGLTFTFSLLCVDVAWLIVTHLTPFTYTETSSLKITKVDESCWVVKVL